MAKHKKKRTKKTSQGLRHSVSLSNLRAARDAVPFTDVALNKVKAWMSGSNPWITIDNPNTAETNRRFIKVRADRYFGGAYKELKTRFKREREGAVA